MTGTAVVDVAGRAVPAPEVSHVLRRGRRLHGDLVVAHVVERGGSEPTRVAVVASRRVGGAVRRNRAKRLLRVAASALPDHGLDVVLVARSATAASTSTAVAAEVEHLFGRAAERPVSPTSPRRGGGR